MYVGVGTPPPPARQVGQRQSKPPSQHGDQDGGGGGFGKWASMPCPPPPRRKAIFFPPRETQQLREQLAMALIKEGPTLPPLSVPELNKALERPQLTQRMRLILSNLKAYVRMRAGEVGRVRLPVEFKGRVANDMMDLSEQLAWRTWDCVYQSQTPYVRRYAGSTSSTVRSHQHHAALADTTEALGDNSLGAVSSSG